MDRESGAYRGHARNYLPVLVHAHESQINHEIEVTIDGLENGWLMGKLVESTEKRTANCEF